MLRDFDFSSELQVEITRCKNAVGAQTALRLNEG
jgi:hypothetical protein